MTKRDSPSPERKYWLGFALVPSVGIRRVQMLVESFGSLSAAWNASENALRAAGMDGQALQNLIRVRAQINLDAELERIARSRASLITRDDSEYPALLKQVSDAPTILYVRGQITDSDSRALAIVGTRKATHYGSDAAYRLSKELARHGVTIISGLAHGIDAAAHRGALDAGGRTFAVLGSGIDQIYPREHHELASQIAAHGALISEFPLGAKPEAHHFPRRNRIISGLSLGVLVIEAPEKSGALITATAALEQGRDVFALPGSIFSAASRGTNHLIQDGAKLIMDVDDILEELDLVHEQVETRAAAERVHPDSEPERLVLQLLSHEPIHIDDIIRQSGMSASLVTSTLTILELKGLARMIGGMNYLLGMPS